MSSLAELARQITELREAALHEEEARATELAGLDAQFARGGRNLLHYMSLRRQDLRPLQRELARIGLSSLGRMEKCVLPTLDAVSHALACLNGHDGARIAPSIDFEAAETELEEHALGLFGPARAGRSTRVMVTLAEDAKEKSIVELLESGAEVARVSCAKGNAESWAKLVEHVRAAERKTGKPCRVLCDLPGPNPRTRALDSDDDAEVAGKVSDGERLLIARDRGALAAIPKKQRHGVVALGVSLPQILGDLKPGQRMFYDDSKLIAEVKSANAEHAELKVTFVKKPQLKLRYGKTLNFPDTELHLEPLTEADFAALDFIVQHADAIGFSFVRSVEDVARLQHELAERDARKLGMVLKIELPHAFNALPRLLLQAMQSPNVGVMVARGDMAVELGFVELAEAQEEILWLCEAALVPVIWATQVLESLNQTGVPTRAEVTDAAMGARAECVMLNQGKHQAHTVEFIAKILERVSEHHQKKRDLLAHLRSCDFAN